MKSKRIETMKRAMEAKRREGSSTGSIVQSIKGAKSLRVAKDRAHEAMEKQMSKAGVKYTPHMQEQLLKGVEQAYYNKDFHIRERDRYGR